MVEVFVFHVTSQGVRRGWGSKGTPRGAGVVRILSEGGCGEQVERGWGAGAGGTR
jgi:hypothetical protein